MESASDANNSTAVVQLEPIRSNELVQVNQSDAVLAIIERSLVAGVAMDQLERLYQLHEKMEQKKARAAYFDAMARAQNNIQNVVKNRNNSHTQSNYADLAAVNAAIVPAYSAEGLSVSSGMLEAATQGTVHVYMDVQHKEGHKERFEGVYPLDGGGLRGNTNKTAIQALGSTITYAKRYLLVSIFNVATDDNDGNGQPKQNAQRKQSNDEFYSDESFGKQFPVWTDSIKKGKKTPQQVISFLYAKGVTLSPDQIKKIELVKQTNQD